MTTKIKKYNLTLLFSVFFLVSISESICHDSLWIKKFKPHDNSSLFLFTAGYKMPVNTNAIINSGHGLYFEGGVNPGHLISKKLVVGFYVGWAFMDRFWSTSFKNDFTNDYSASINKEKNFSSFDSAVIYSSADLFKGQKGRSVTLPGCQMRSFHDYSLYYGLVIKLPYKYVPVVKVYTGSTRSYFMGDGNIVTPNQDYSIFELRRMMYGCELIIFRGLQGKSNDLTQKYPSYKNTGMLSIYYESNNFYNSTLHFDNGNQKTEIPLRNFVSSSFLQKYRSDVYFGLKLSFSIM